jgi:hypothetical protein
MSNPSHQEQENTNKRVYFLCGFDTRGVRFYHRLFREEARKSAKLNGLNISTTKPTMINGVTSRWFVNAQDSKTSTSIDYRFLIWDDVVHRLWINHIIQLICTFIPTFYQYFIDGTHKKIRRAGNGAYLLIMYPFWFILGTVSVSVALALSVYLLSQLFGASMSLSIALSLLATFFSIKEMLALGERKGAWFMMQNYIFYTRWGRAPITALENRLDVFAQQIIEDYLANPNQDILFVTHCSGGTLAMPIMQRLLKQAPAGLHARLKLLTLGQCIPFLTYNPNAQHYRDTVHAVAKAQSTIWIDIGARIDPFSFDEINPTYVEGLQKPHEGFLQQFIIRPIEMYDNESFLKLKKQKLRLHFQYLMASDIPVEYDYFKIVTQPDFDFNRLEPSKLKPIL